MIHPLAIYTVVYVAILFVTVSIWGSDIALTTGDTRILLFALGAFSLKLAIDDYLHFQRAKLDHLELDLFLSLVIYLLLAASIAHTAIGRTQVGAIQFALVFAVGTIWLFYSGFSGKDRNRRFGWLIVNLIAIALLVWAAVLKPQSIYTAAKLPLTLLFILIVGDFFIFRTLGRLAESEEPATTAAQVAITAAQSATKAQELAQAQAAIANNAKTSPQASVAAVQAKVAAQNAALAQAIAEAQLNAASKANELAKDAARTAEAAAETAKIIADNLAAAEHSAAVESQGAAAAKAKEDAHKDA